MKGDVTKKKKRHLRKSEKGREREGRRSREEAVKPQTRDETLREVAIGGDRRNVQVGGCPFRITQFVLSVKLNQLTHFLLCQLVCLYGDYDEELVANKLSYQTN